MLSHRATPIRAALAALESGRAFGLEWLSEGSQRGETVSRKKLGQGGPQDLRGRIMKASIEAAMGRSG